MKWIKRLVILIVLLVVAAGVILYLSLNHIIKSVVESQGTQQLHVQTTLDAVTLGLIHGTVNLDNFAIGSPAGFTAPQMMSVGKLAVDSGGIANLRGNPIKVTSIQIDKPLLVIEQKGGGINFKALIDGMPKSTESKTAKKEPQPSKSEEMKLVIDQLNITNAHVKVISDLPMLKKGADIDLPAMNVKNIGNADGAENGAAIKDIVTTVITTMVQQATKSGKLPIDLTGLLNGNLDDVKGKLGDTAQKELDKLKVPVNVGGLLDQVTGKKK